MASVTQYGRKGKEGEKRDGEMKESEGGQITGFKIITPHCLAVLKRVSMLCLIIYHDEKLGTVYFEHAIGYNSNSIGDLSQILVPNRKFRGRSVSDVVQPELLRRSDQILPVAVVTKI